MLLINGIQMLFIWSSVADWQPTSAAPDPSPQWISSLFGGGKTLEPTGENLWKEAEKGDLESVKDLVSRGADVNYGGGMALWYATRNGHVDIVKYLLDSGANPNGGEERVYFGNIIAKAAEHNQLEIIDLLLAANASVTPPKYGTDILYNAAKNGHLEAIQKLIQAGADVNFKYAFALLGAAENGRLEVVNEFIKGGVDVNVGSGWALTNAGRAGQTEVMKALIEAGATKESLDRAMFSAAGNGHFETVKLLFDNGADPNYDGTLKAAATYGNVDIVKLLLDNGAQITYEGTNNPGGPLHFAASKGHIDVVALLVKHGADINRALTKDTWIDFSTGATYYGEGWTAMHVIARFGHPYVKELLDLGADINAKDASGNTPLQVAVFFKKLEMTKEFLKFCSDASVVNNEGNTALDLAMKVAEENSTTTEPYKKLSAVMRESIPGKLATTHDNEEGTRALRNEFILLANTSSTLKEKLKNVTYDRTDIDVAIHQIFLEDAQRELPKVIEDIYCKPSIQKEHRVSIGTEYLAKCECVPGEGPTMTYTPMGEGVKCLQATSTKTENPPQEPAAISA